jgi:hypothetical protein
MNSEIPLAVQISEVEREIKMRESVYRRRVEDGKMKHADADRRIRIMREVLVSLQELRRAQINSNSNN